MKDHDHRCFAAFYDAITRAEPPSMKALRASVIGGAAGRVLEVGAGPGVNFALYGNAAEVVAIEPDAAMLPCARRHLEEAPIPITLLRASAEVLPFPDRSFDTAVCSLVLCTVRGQPRALAEIRRVLRPDGTLRFLEHVRGDGPEGYVWDLVTPIWRIAAAGCHPNRRTADAIGAAGFEVTEFRQMRLPDLLPAIMGVARPISQRH